MSEGQIVMYGTPWCGDCARARRVLETAGTEYHYIDIVGNAEASAIVERINNGNRSVPTIIFPDGSVLVEPSNAELEAKISPAT